MGVFARRSEHAAAFLHLLAFLKRHIQSPSCDACTINVAADLVNVSASHLPYRTQLAYVRASRSLATLFLQTCFSETLSVILLIDMQLTNDTGMAHMPGGSASTPLAGDDESPSEDKAVSMRSHGVCTD